MQKMRLTGFMSDPLADRKYKPGLTNAGRGVRAGNQRKRGRLRGPVSCCGRNAQMRCSMPNSAKPFRSEEHTSELQSLMRISYAVFCLKKKKTKNTTINAKRYRQIT